MIRSILNVSKEVFKDTDKSKVLLSQIDKQNLDPHQSTQSTFEGITPADYPVVTTARKRATAQDTGEAPPPDK